MVDGLGPSFCRGSGLRSGITPDVPVFRKSADSAWMYGLEASSAMCPHHDGTLSPLVFNY